MTLDDKLRYVVKGEILTDKEIAQIKQAFADEGYLPHVDSGKHVKVGDKLYITNGSDSLVRVDLAKYMTGQEWYDRFVNALDDEFHFMTKPVNIDSSVYYDAPNVMKAAKKASGL